MITLGISCYYHDSAACLVKDGKIIAAAQEERFSRIKHDHEFPTQAIKYCLKEAAISASRINSVVFYEKPLLKFDRIIESFLQFAPRGLSSFIQSMPIWLKDKAFLRRELSGRLREIDSSVAWKRKLLFSEHHLSHAASAFFPSPFERAAILTMDGVGEWATTSMGIGDEKGMRITKEIRFPHSLGLLYSAFTAFAGFKVNSGEYKLMGLAPYGNPKYSRIILDNLIDLKSDGTFHLNMGYFDFGHSLKMTGDKFNELFGRLPRDAESRISQQDMDIAASIQQVTNEVVLRLAASIKKETQEENLCLAGGVALNCVSNGQLLKSGLFKRIWVQPAAGDAGGALGAALLGESIIANSHRRDQKSDSMNGSFLGPQFLNEEIRQILEKQGARFEYLTEALLIQRVVESLVSGQAVGWFQGRMEFGPRALGSRSILADPRSSTMQKSLNMKIKFRESFRPFAPSVLSEHLSDWFETTASDPYMMFVTQLQEFRRLPVIPDPIAENQLLTLDVKRSEIPAVTHVDYSARVQSVARENNPLFHKLISEFYIKTGVPMLVNTSFNVRGEPIVCTPEDALRCFMGTNIEVLAIGNFLLEKLKQPQEKLIYYHENLPLD